MDLVTQAMNELEKEYLDVLVPCLEVIQNRFNYIMCKYPDTVSYTHLTLPTIYSV